MLNKKSVAYYLALHDQLEREASFTPATTEEVHVANRKMEEQILGLPDGEILLNNAKQDAKSDCYLKLAGCALKFAGE